jgi:hypothetical protein
MSRVRVTPGAPFLCFYLLADQVEWLSVSWIETYSVNPAVRKYHYRERLNLWLAAIPEWALEGKFPKTALHKNL